MKSTDLITIEAYHDGTRHIFTRGVDELNYTARLLEECGYRHIKEITED